MEFSNLFIRVVELSPFVAALLYFLVTVWKSLQKKDEALTETMKDHATAMMTMQRDNIMAQNNMATSNRTLAESIDKFRNVISDSQEEISDKLDRMRKPVNRNGQARNGTVKPMPLITDSATA